MKGTPAFAATLTLILTCNLAFAGDAVIIANAGVKATSVSTNELRDVFTGTKNSLGGGVHVVPVTLKGGPAHEAFLKQIIGKFDGAFRAGWRSLLFTGQGSLPKAFDTQTELVHYVAAPPGAIGYVGSDAKLDNVKTLSVK